MYNDEFFNIDGIRPVKARHQKVTVVAPARLHMGFIDLSGALGRDFGSIGVGLDKLETRLSITMADSLSVSGLATDRVTKFTQRFCQALTVSDALAIEMHSIIPEHIGLGSGTQMALAIGMGINRFYELGLSVRDIAHLADRGARSGIGIGVFEKGGLIVDGGRGSQTRTPPILAQMSVPNDWRFILVFDERGQGLHGEQEIAAFKQLPAFPRSEAERLSYLLLMQALPALAEQDLPKFGDVISQLQAAVGEHFAPVQGGIFTSQEVADAIDYLQTQGATGIGQTSWGPTGFCIIDNPQRATELVEQLQQRYTRSPLSFSILSARNTGAKIVVE